MPIKTEKLMSRLEKLEDKFRLSSLEIEKRLADIELTKGESDEGIKTILSRMETLKKDVDKKLKSTNILSEVQEMRGLTNRIQSEFESLKHEMNELKKRVDSSQKKDFSPLIEKLGTEIASLKQQLNKVNTGVDVYLKTIESLKNDFRLTDKTYSELNSLRREIEGFREWMGSSQKSLKLEDLDIVTERLEVINSEISDLKEKFSKVETPPTGGILEEDLITIKSKVQRLGSLEDEVSSLRIEIGLLKSYQMHTIPPEMFAEMSERLSEISKKLNSLENKVSEVEKKKVEELIAQPVIIE